MAIFDLDSGTMNVEKIPDREIGLSCRWYNQCVLTESGELVGLSQDQKEQKQLIRYSKEEGKFEVIYNVRRRIKRKNQPSVSFFDS